MAAIVAGLRMLICFRLNKIWRTTIDPAGENMLREQRQVIVPEECGVPLTVLKVQIIPKGYTAQLLNIF
jgi:hypothetical protein